MAGWHSLSGYLYYRPGGALGKLKGRKRLWYLFEERECQLLYYKSQEEARTKEPQGAIPISNAAISVNIDNDHQFVIYAGDREHLLTTDSHESMMIWLLGLQAKRDGYNERQGQQIRARSNSETDVRSGRCSSEPGLRRASVALMKLDDLKRQRLLRRVGASMDTGSDLLSGWNVMMGSSSSQELPEEGQDVMPLLGSPSPNPQAGAREAGTREESQEPLLGAQPTPYTSLENIADEVFTHEEQTQEEQSTSEHSDRFQWLRKIQSEAGGGRHPVQRQEAAGEWVRLPSGRSASSDSAVDSFKTDSEALNRVSDLEQELITAKCELAAVMNRETCYKEILVRRDTVILQLDEKLEELEELQLDKKSQDKKLRERIRTLQNQNRFLTEEVKKLASMKLQPKEPSSIKLKQVSVLEAEIEQWKRDYVFLVQSSISIPTGDAMDGMEVRLYGGNRHKERIKELLEEARQINPTLPTFEKLAKSSVHIDQYGFQHSHDNEGLLLHYICQQLNGFYATQLASYEEHQRKWGEILSRGKIGLLKMKDLKWMVRRGIPAQFRADVWRHLINQRVTSIKEERGQHYYSYLCNVAHDSQDAGRYRKQISLDLLRTMPTNVNFGSTEAAGIQKLQEVLVAFSMHNPGIGYSQGMNFLVGMFLLFMDAEDAFWALVAVTEKYFSTYYFDQNLSGVQADQEVLREILQQKLPDLSQHLNDLDIDISSITLTWFLAVFFDAVPFETLLRIWDCFLLEGPKVLFRFALAVLHLNKPVLLQKRDTISIMRHLKACTRIMFDAEGLIKAAYEELKPFPRRQDITSRQLVYHNTLKEKLRRREALRKAYSDREQLLRDLELNSGSASVIECATSSEEGILWLCHGEQNVGRVCLVDVGGGLVYHLEVVLDSRIMCANCLSEDILLIGTLSKWLYAFHTRTRHKLWSVPVHDAILSICCHLQETCNKVFIALADGTVAVLENIGLTEPREDPLYIPIGRNPVTMLTLWDGYVWAGCGNCVTVLSADSLDTWETIIVSNNVFDHVLSVVPSEHGMWISLKGSSMVQLWDVEMLTCRLLFDIKENKYPDLKKEDHESKLNMGRVTTLLPVGNTLWVGTGQGTLIIYEIGLKPNKKAKTPSPISSPQLPAQRSKSPVKDECNQKKNENKSSGEVKLPIDGASEAVEYTDVHVSGHCDRSGSCTDKSDQTETESCTETKSNVRLKRKTHTNAATTYPKPVENQNISARESRKKSASRSQNTSGSQSNTIVLKSRKVANSSDNMETESDISISDKKEAIGKVNSPKIVSSKRKTVKDLGKLHRSTAVVDDGTSSSSVDKDLKDVQISRSRVAKDKTPRRSHVLPNPDEEQTQLSHQVPTKPYTNGGLNLKRQKSDINGKSNTGVKSGISSKKSPSNDIKMGRNEKVENPDKLESSDQLENFTDTTRLSESDDVGGGDDLSNNEIHMADSNGLHKMQGTVSDVSVFVVHEKSPSTCCYQSNSELPPLGANGVNWTGHVESSSMQECLGHVDSSPSGNDSPHDNSICERACTVIPALTCSVPISANLNDNFGKSPNAPLSPISERPESLPLFSTVHTDRKNQYVQTLLVGDVLQINVDSASELSATEVSDNGQVGSTRKLSDNGVQVTTASNLRRHQVSVREMGSSALWSSFDESNSPVSPQVPLDEDSQGSATPVHGGSKHRRGRLSRSSSASLASLLGDLPYMYDLSVQAKVKVSDKPIKCLIKTSVNGEPTIISCAGCYGDDEAVLRWRKEDNEMLWTNEPIYEVCPETHLPKTPRYMQQIVPMASAQQNPENG